MTIFGIPLFKIVLFSGIMLIVSSMMTFWKRKTKFPYVTKAKCIRFETKTINEEEIKIPIWRYRIHKNEHIVQDPRFKLEYNVKINDCKEICCNIDDKTKFIFNKESALKDTTKLICGIGLFLGGVLLYINYLTATFSS